MVRVARSGCFDCNRVTRGVWLRERLLSRSPGACSMVLTKSLPPPRDFLSMLAQAKYDTRTVSDALWRAFFGARGKLSRHARIEALRRRVGMGRVRLSGWRCLRIASLGLGQPQSALWLGSSALLLDRSRDTHRSCGRVTSRPSGRAGPQLCPARAHP